MYQTNHSTDSCTRMLLLASEIVTFLAFPKTWKSTNLLRRRPHDPPPPFRKPRYLYIYYMHLLRFELNFIHFNNLPEIIL